MGTNYLSLHANIPPIWNYVFIGLHIVPQKLSCWWNQCSVLSSQLRWSFYSICHGLLLPYFSTLRTGKSQGSVVNLFFIRITKGPHFFASY
jgi:hypothetical protein